LSPASASSFWDTKTSYEPSMPLAYTSLACLMVRVRYSSYADRSETAMRTPARSTSAIERIGEPAGTR
jgi:hypothetical protein